MNNFENPEHIYSRQEILDRVISYPLEDPLVKKMVKDWVANETEKEGLMATPKGVVFSLIKEAALYFDAGYKKESISILKRANLYSKIKDKPPHTKGEAVITVDIYGDIKKKEELYDYFLTISRELEKALNNSRDYKEHN